MAIKTYFLSLFLIPFIVSCGGDKKTNSETDNTPKARIKISDLVFEDDNLAKCVQTTLESSNEPYEYADELLSLECPPQQGKQAANNPGQIQSTQGIEQLTGLEHLGFSNQPLSNLDLAAFKNLKTLYQENTQLKSIDLSKNTNLEEVSLGLHSTNSSIINLDLTSNQKLRNVTAKSITALKLPKNIPLHWLDVRFKAKLSEIEPDLFTGHRLNIDLSTHSQLQYLSLHGQFSRITLPTNGSLSILNIHGNETVNIEGLMHQEKLTALNIPIHDKEDVLALQRLTKLTHINLRANQLDAISFTGPESLIDLEIKGKNIEAITINSLPNLQLLDLNTPKVQSLKVTDTQNLVWFSYEPGELRELSFERAGSLNTIDIKNTLLKSLSLTECEQLHNLYIGSSQLTELDISHCDNLIELFLGRSEINQLDLSNHESLGRAGSSNNLIVQDSVKLEQYQLETIKQLIDSLKVPDKALANCILKSAETQEATYPDELTELYCNGGDGKNRALSISDYSQSEEPGPSHVFSTEGLKYFSSLKTIDLSGNWIDSITLDYPNNIETLILDYNVIQDLNLLDYLSQLTTLSINGNPLKTLSVPLSLQYLHANSITDWGNNIYLSVSLAEQHSTPRMQVIDTEEPLTPEHYSKNFELINSNKLILLEEFHSDKWEM